MSGNFITITNGAPWSAEEPKTWIFNSELELDIFLDSARKVMLYTIDKFNYNSVPSFLEFYRGYKASKLASVEEFYTKQYEVQFKKDNLSCVGLCYVFKEELMNCLSARGCPELSEYLYFASCNLFPNHAPPETVKIGNPLCPAELTEHVTLVLKFWIQDRGGHVVMDSGFGIHLPVVVMDDGKHPQTGVFHKLSRTGIREHDFRNVGAFIHWSSQDSFKTEHRWFYVKRCFERLDLPEKRHKLNPAQAAVAYKNGDILAGYFGTVGSSKDEITVFYRDRDTIRSDMIPYSEITLQNTVLDTCLSYMGEGERDTLISFVLACQDELFARQVFQLDKMCRDKLIKIWCT